MKNNEEIPSYTFEEFENYMQCPMKHHLMKDIRKYNNKIDFSVLRLQYQESIEATMNYYFSQIANDEIVTYKGLLFKFETDFDKRIGFNNKHILDRKYTDNNELLVRKRKEKMFLAKKELNVFYKNASNQNHQIIAHNYPFEIDFKDFKIKDKFDLVRERLDLNDGKRYIELVIYKSSKAVDSDFIITHDYRTTFLYHAFNDIFGKAPEKIILYYLLSNTEVSVFRDDKECNRLFNSLVNFNFLMINNNNMLYANQSSHCASCPVKQLCNKFEY